MANLYFVNHPDSEVRVFYSGATPPNVRETAPILWNCQSSHKRKFIKYNGEYVNDINDYQPKKSDLFFWGEYEAFSIAQYTGKNYPSTIHKSLGCVENVKTLPFTALNTDPYVFGNEFKYSCCGKRNHKFEIGSIVLFGKLKGWLFEIDTLIVIDKPEVNSSMASLQYYVAGLLLGKIKNYSTGQMFNKTHHDCYSFVPCKIANPDMDINFIDGKKPSVNLQELYNKYDKIKHEKLNPQNISPIKNIPLINVWKDIANSITNQGFKLGVHFKEIEGFHPYNFNHYNHNENKF